MFMLIVNNVYNVNNIIRNLFYSGIFFVLPCIESYQKVDLRTITLGVPPQEVYNYKK